MKTEKRRSAALHGLRGILSFTILVVHILSIYISPPALFWWGRVPVLLFFAMSSYLLSKGWGSQTFLAFIIRRFIRLWPVFAVCVAGSAWYSSIPLHLSWFFWVPSMVPVDMPTWSLGIEVRAMLFMPIIVWTSRGSLTRSVIAIAVWYFWHGLTPNFSFGAAFLIGARLSMFDFKFRLLEQEIFQWLGNISYSLYLSHWPVIGLLYARWGIGGSLIATPVTLVVAWILWRLVERPSIMLSKNFNLSSVSRFSSRFSSPISGGQSVGRYLNNAKVEHPENIAVLRKTRV